MAFMAACNTTIGTSTVWRDHVDLAIGFAVDSRSQVNADRAMQSAASQGSMATIGRAERQLTAMGTTLPVAVVQADLAAATVPAPVWARTKECTAITLPESYAACAAVVSLRRELAVAVRQHPDGGYATWAVLAPGDGSDINAGRLKAT